MLLNYNINRDIEYGQSLRKLSHKTRESSSYLLKQIFLRKSCYFAKHQIQNTWYSFLICLSPSLSLLSFSCFIRATTQSRDYQTRPRGRPRFTSVQRACIIFSHSFSRTRTHTHSCIHMAGFPPFWLCTELFTMVYRLERESIARSQTRWRRQLWSHLDRTLVMIVDVRQSVEDEEQNQFFFSFFFSFSLSFLKTHLDEHRVSR